MNDNHDFFNNQGHLPFTFTILTQKKHPMLWHKEIEIILVLSGKLNVDLGHKTYTLEKKDLLLLNTNEGHSLTHACDNTVVLSLKINPTFYKNYYSKLLDISLDCKSFLFNGENSKYEQLRHLLAKMMSIFYDNDEYAHIHLLKESLYLLEYLLSNFKGDKETIRSYEKYSHERLRRIMNFIEYNYTQKITLSDLAQMEFISVHYLSKLFKKNLSIGFHEYLSQFRLNKSMKDLLYTNKNIIDVALDNGFPNVKSYTKLFKEKHTMTPDEFRKNINSKDSYVYSDSFNIPDDYKEIIKSFITKQGISLKEDPKLNHSINVDINKPVGMHNKFEKILYFDLVYDGLNTNWQDNLKKIQQEMKFDYIRFSGIFTEGMYFYNKEENTYNWFNIDTLLDFFMKNNLKPFIELYYTSKKYSLSRWHTLLQNFLQHCIDRYGLYEVQRWKFEFSSEDRNYEKSISLYVKTINVVMKNFAKLKFGILFVPAPNFEELYFLINFENRNLDFMSVEMTEDAFLKKKSLVKELLANIRKMNLKTYFIKVENNHYLNDTSFKASYMINEILNDLDESSRQITFVDDLRSSKMFYGDLGLLTYNGFKKPTYNSFYLLTKLKGLILKKGPNYLILRNNNKFQILLYNYSEIKDYSMLTFEQYKGAKEVLIDNKTHIEVTLNLSNGKYKFKTYTLSSRSGCIFNAWIDLGASNNLTSEDLEYLNYKEQMDLSIATTYIDQSYTIREDLGNDTVKLIQIEKI
ncbi:GH39 family glycosyl hydrolase [Anaeromicrobium sediminis]|uniref:HTH araC/xylS-type domain-containing protein n=1 Tax=Anaeromicrobium sediminis TaxID=1478221 RepID=A0A267MHS1_9FIRM|nr:helix-turn-helix domain-containing protein [Anaeromicrobium sediminis]PAB59119.1 hypothetical protein CCE28_11415 [Anaeromicrobium sediminis]